jgi:hypothetical protein
MSQRCEPSIRENCTMVMKTECNEVCREECEDKDKKVCMTIPHQVLGAEAHFFSRPKLSNDTTIKLGLITWKINFF